MSEKYLPSRKVPSPRSEIDTSRAVTGPKPIDRAPNFYPGELQVGEGKPNSAGKP
jgi:hypothetical protein